MVPDMLWIIAMKAAQWLIQPTAMKVPGKMRYLIFSYTLVCSKVPQIWEWFSGSLCYHYMHYWGLQKEKTVKVEKLDFVVGSGMISLLSQKNLNQQSTCLIYSPQTQLYYFHKTAITISANWEAKSKKNVLSYSPRDQKYKIKVLVRLLPSEGFKTESAPCLSPRFW